MKITILGAAQTVTGSQILLEINGSSLLLDCGLYQGRRQESYERNRSFAFDPRGLDAAILSHAHIDHSGNLPNLVKCGYGGDIYATPATVDLAEIMLMDSGYIQESDAAFVNKKRFKRGEPPVEPLYTQADAARAASFFRRVEYGQAFEPIPGVSARLVEAGHILGSAAVSLEVEENGRRLRLWFSGDIGRLELPLLRDPVLPDNPDYLIMECTYGNKRHRDPQAGYDELRQVVGDTVARGGKVIIPAFAVGRTQELVYNLHRMMQAREIPRIPVYVDSPLAVNASDIFRAHPECLDEEAKEFAASSRISSVLGFDLLTYVRSVDESKALNDKKEPMVIISASGMAETGRILHHLKNNIRDPRNTILIVSWQAPHTLGRRLADRETRVKIFGEVYKRKAQVATIGGFSAHGDQDFLFEYAMAGKGQLKKVFLVHGEAKGAGALSERLVEAGLEKILIPYARQMVEV